MVPVSQSRSKPVMKSGVNTTTTTTPGKATPIKGDPTIRKAGNAGNNNTRPRSRVINPTTQGIEQQSSPNLISSSSQTQRKPLLQPEVTNTNSNSNSNSNSGTTAGVTGVTGTIHSNKIETDWPTWAIENIVIVIGWVLQNRLKTAGIILALIFGLWFLSLLLFSSGGAGTGVNTTTTTNAATNAAANNVQLYNNMEVKKEIEKLKYKNEVLEDKVMFLTAIVTAVSHNVTGSNSEGGGGGGGGGTLFEEEWEIWRESGRVVGLMNEWSKKLKEMKDGLDKERMLFEKLRDGQKSGESLITEEMLARLMRNGIQQQQQQGGGGGVQQGERGERGGWGWGTILGLLVTLCGVGVGGYWFFIVKK